MKIVDLNRETKADLLGKLLKRKPDSFPEQEKQVAAIIDDVRNRGDDAIFEYAEKFDHCKLTAETFRVTDEEVAEAVRTVGEDLMGVMGRSINNIRSFHECQKRQSFFNTKENGVILGQRISPIESRGICSRRKSGLSQFSSYECGSGPGCGRKGDNNDHPRKQ